MKELFSHGTRALIPDLVVDLTATLCWLVGTTLIGISHTFYIVSVPLSIAWTIVCCVVLLVARKMQSNRPPRKQRLLRIGVILAALLLSPVAVLLIQYITWDPIGLKSDLGFGGPPCRVYPSQVIQGEAGVVALIRHNWCILGFAESSETYFVFVLRRNEMASGRNLVLRYEVNPEYDVDPDSNAARPRVWWISPTDLRVDVPPRSNYGSTKKLATFDGVSIHYSGVD